MRVLVLLAVAFLGCAPSAKLDINLETGTLNGEKFYQLTPDQIRQMLGAPTSEKSESASPKQHAPFQGMAYSYPDFGLSFMFTHSAFDTLRHCESIHLVIRRTHNIDSYDPEGDSFHGHLLPHVTAMSGRKDIHKLFPDAILAREDDDWNPSKHDSVYSGLGLPPGSLYVYRDDWIKQANYDAPGRKLEKNGMIIFSIPPSKPMLHAITMMVLPFGVLESPR